MKKKTGGQKSRWTVPLSSKNLTPCSVSLRGIDFFKLAHLKDKIKMLAYIKIVQMYFLSLILSFKARRCLRRQNFCPHAVLASAESESLQC